MSDSLFGYDIPERFPPRSPYQAWKIGHSYHKSKSKTVKCEHCINLIQYKYHTKPYNKCKLLGESNSMATDIRLSYVCDLFEEVKK